MRADEELGAVAQHATVPMSGGFGLLYETVSVLVDPC